MQRRGLLVVDLETENGWPFLGGIAVMRDGQTLGRAESAIYTRRRVEIPIVSGPLPAEVRLEFDTNYTGLSSAVRRHLIPPPAITLKLPR